MKASPMLASVKAQSMLGPLALKSMRLHQYAPSSNDYSTNDDHSAVTAHVRHGASSSFSLSVRNDEVKSNYEDAINNMNERAMRI